MTYPDQPTMELRFIQRNSEYDGFTKRYKTNRVLQQKRLIDTGSRTLAYTSPGPDYALIERKPDGDGCWAQMREEWHDVPLVTKEPTQ